MSSTLSLPAHMVLRSTPDPRWSATGAEKDVAADSGAATPVDAAHATEPTQTSTHPRAMLTGDQSKALDDLLAAASGPAPDQTASEGGSASFSIDDKLKTLEDSLARLRQSLGSTTYGGLALANTGLAVQRLA